MIDRHATTAARLVTSAGATRGAAPTIAVIGAGRIGLRHLQALARLEGASHLIAVDPNPDARAVIRAEVEGTEWAGTRTTVAIHEEIDALPEQLDAVIVATTADVRLAVIEQVIAGRIIGAIVLEKVLCQSARDCLRVGQVLRDAGIAAWVNCNRRLGSIWSELRAAIARAGPLSVSVSGSQWGLCCNAVHFLDLIVYLTGRGGLHELSPRGLDPGTIPARRSGFDEITGTLTGRLGGDVSFALTCHRPGTAPMAIAIESPRLRLAVFELDDASGTALKGRIAEEADDWRWRDLEGRLPLQSQSTHRIVRDVIETGRCGLPTLADAVALHVPLLRCLNRHIHGREMDDEVRCPIT